MIRDSTAPTAGSAGLRERRKDSTRLALEHAALRLFARDGFDATPIEAIAAEADVSARTFFRYFATKDAVLNPERRSRQALLRAAVLEQPQQGTSDDVGPRLIDVAARAFAAIAPAFAEERETLLLQRRAVLTSPLLRGRLHDVAHSWQRALADALVERTDDGVGVVSLRIQVAAATAVTLWQHAIMTWLDDEAAELELRDHLEAAFAALRDDQR